MGKINWNKPNFHIVPNLAHCRHLHSLLKSLLCCFKMFPSLYYLCQTHLITWNLGYVPYVIIKSSNGFISRQASVSYTQTLHPFTASISAATGQNPFGCQFLPNCKEPERTAHRICTFMEAAARLWNIAQVSESRARRTALTHAGRDRTGAKCCHGPAPWNLEAPTATPHRRHALWPPLNKAEAVEVTFVTCRNLSYAAFLQVFIVTSEPVTAVTPSRSFRTRGVIHPGPGSDTPGAGARVAVLALSSHGALGRGPQAPHRRSRAPAAGAGRASHTPRWRGGRCRALHASRRFGQATGAALPWWGRAKGPAGAERRARRVRAGDRKSVV